jgi:hypothetical protein
MKMDKLLWLSSVGRRMTDRDSLLTIAVNAPSGKMGRRIAFSFKHSLIKEAGWSVPIKLDIGADFARGRVYFRQFNAGLLAHPFGRRFMIRSSAKEIAGRFQVCRTQPMLDVRCVDGVVEATAPPGLLLKNVTDSTGKEHKLRKL